MIEIKKKVLIADDELKILSILSIKLRLSGYEVVLASNGQEVLEQVKAAKPDIMLLDIIMPVMDGFQVLEKLREFSDMPVITFSARPENAQKALSLGANDFLAKPFDIDDLMKRIQKALENKG